MKKSLRDALLGAALCASSAFAQPCLVRGDQQRVGKLEAFARPLEPKFAPVEVAPGLTIAVFPNLISPEARQRLDTELAGVFKGAASADLRLAVFDAAGFRQAGPFSSAAAWRRAVKEALTVSDAAAPASATQVYSAIAASLSSAGRNWQAMLLVGDLPEVEPNIREYAQAWLGSQACAQKVRLGFVHPEGKQSAFWSAIAQTTGAPAGLESLGEALPILNNGPFAEVAWDPPPLTRGFVLYSGNLTVAPGTQLPDLEKYAELAGLEQQLGAAGTDPEQIRNLVGRALAINARDAVALRAGVDLYKRGRDYKTAADLIEKLQEVQSRDAGLDAELGHCRYLAGEMEAAEKALLRGRERGAGGIVATEELARIHLARKDDAGALPLLDETLKGDGKRAELWFLRADIGARTGKWELTAESLEKGVAIDGQNLERRTALIELYLDHSAGAKALPLIQAVTTALPADAGVRRRYAEYLDRLNRPEEALVVWKKAIEADPSSETAHYRVARLLLDSGDAKESLAAVEKGLSAAPKSGRLYLIKAEVLQGQGRFYEARQTLRWASQSVEDAALLARLAEMEDVSGTAAAQAYWKAAASAEKAGAALDAAVLERGLEVAIRDGDSKAAESFAGKLNAAGRSDAAALLPRHGERTKNAATVPGGIDALSFMIHSHSRSPEAFFAEYCRTLVDRLGVANEKERKSFAESVHNYFQELADLKALGMRKDNTTTLVLSGGDKKAQQRTEKALEILGWKLRNNKGTLTVEAGEKKSQAGRQETASALALDEVGMQDALRAGKSFPIEITDEAAPVLLGESVWMKTFFDKTNFNGGLAEAMLGSLRVVKTYAALNSMSPRAVSVLAGGSDLKSLAEKHADLLYRYSSSFALSGDHATVPGGPAAEAVWASLAGVPPAQAGKFFQALLNKEDGKLLAFFSILGQVDSAHQRFFTRSVARATRFYGLFRDSIDLWNGAVNQGRNQSFPEFLRGVPIDADLHVLFPGGPEVWMLAKGTSSSVAKSAKMVKKLSRITEPEAEDDILDRLARTRYKVLQEHVSELDHFLAVVRIDAHRPDPLDEASALLLAQHYGTDRPIYPYFAVLTALQQPQFEHFFALTEQLRTVSKLDLNVILGQLHSLIELICLSQEAGSLKPEAAAELFDALCLRFTKAVGAAGGAGGAGYTHASLDTVRDLLKRASTDEATGDPDGALERALLGRGTPVAFEVGGAHYELDPSAARRGAYEGVLREQKVTTLKTLLTFYECLQNLSQGKGSIGEQVKTVESLRASLLTVPIPKAAGVSAQEHKIASAFEEAKTAELIARLKQRAAKKKVNPKDLAETAEELAAAICPQVTVALSGAVYAYFLSPNDLLISQDPLLLRKHHYLTFEPMDKALFPVSDVHTSSSGLGSNLIGGFADFPITAGKVALSGASPSPNTADLAAAQIGSLRATDWSHVEEQDLFLFGLRLRLAREWIVHAAADANLAAGLAEDSQGLLSPTRRSDLLDAIAARDWKTVFQSVSQGDLYALSEKYLDRYPGETWQSPVLAALRRLHKRDDSERLRWLGPSAPDLWGCSHPHFDMAGPYEEYERLIFPAKLTERTAEFKLYLADFAGRTGIPPAALNVIGEPITMQVFKGMQLTNQQDWRDAQTAFSSLNEAVVRAALPGEK